MSKLVPRGPAWFADRYQIDVQIRHEVTQVDPQARTVEVTDLDGNTSFTDTYDVLVLATGASPVLPDMPGIRSAGVFPVSTPTDAESIRAHLETGVTNAVVLGGGFIGLEMVEQLVGRGVRTTLVEREQQVMPALDSDVAELVEDTLHRHGVTVRLGRSATAIHGDPVTGVELDFDEPLTAQLVIAALGIRPNTRLAVHAGVTLGDTGAIAVDARMATKRARHLRRRGCGRVVRHPHQAAVLAAPGHDREQDGTHRRRCDHRRGHDPSRDPRDRHLPRLSDLAVAQTGLTERAAAELGIDVMVQDTTKADHSEYLGGQDLLLKTVADRATGRLLGAQAVGPQGVDKRIDVLATAITFGAHVEDLFHLDLAYAPLFSTTKDPIHYAGMALTKAWRDAPGSRHRHVVTSDQGRFANRCRCGGHTGTLELWLSTMLRPAGGSWAASPSRWPFRSPTWWGSAPGSGCWTWAADQVR